MAWEDVSGEEQAVSGEEQAVLASLIDRWDLDEG